MLSQQKDGEDQALGIWRRETRVEAVEGGERLRVVQRCDVAGPPSASIHYDSSFEIGTFRPLNHLRVTNRDGARTVEGFLFRPDAIVGDPGVAGNTRADFVMPSPEPAYNFETDIEFLQTLPLSAGYAVSIPFFHPGGRPPARYVWKVTGGDRLTGPDGAGIDCWIVETDYNRPDAPTARFWMAKSTQQMIKTERLGANGVLSRKTWLF